MEQTGTMSGQAAQASLDRSLQAMVQRFNEAFNRFDTKAVASFWADDGTLITPIGSYGQGRAGVERVYGEDAQTILAGTTSRFTISRARVIGGDCMLLDLDHDVQNFQKPDGSTGNMKLHLVALVQKRGDTWQYLDARPYAFMERPQRLH